MTVSNPPPVTPRRRDPSECPNCHGVPETLPTRACHRCQNTGRVRPSPRDPATRPIELAFDAAYEMYPGGVMNDSVTDWRVYVEPSTIAGRHDIYLQDKIHPADAYHRICVYANCKRDSKYDDIRLFLLHLTSRAPLNMLQAGQWVARPF